MLQEQMKGGLVKRNAKRGQVFAVIGFVIISIMYFGCSSARLADTWRDPVYREPPMKKILVVAAKKNNVDRRIWEDILAEEISDHGVSTIPSYRLFADAIPDTQRLSETIRQEQFDGVLVIHKLPAGRSARVAPGYYQTVPVARYNYFTDSYDVVYQEVYRPGYVESTQIVRHEVMLYSTGENGHMVWGAIGELIDPSSRKAVRQEITKLIIPALAKQKLIPGN